MKQTVNGTHEVFGRDNVIEVAAEVFQGDVGSVEIKTSFTQDGAPLDLSGWTVSVTNRAPNGEMVMRVGGTEPPLVVDGASVTWTLQAFDTAQAGTYTAQLRAVSAEQTVTVVFFRYNVERSVAGNLSSVPVQYATLSMLVSEIQGMRKELAEMDAQVNQMQALFDLFMTIIGDGGVSWDTLVGKPETFPPSPHSHDEFATLQGNIDRLSARTDGVRCEIVNEPYTILASGWVENDAEMRKEYTLAHTRITQENFPRVVLPNSLGGKMSLSVLPRPMEGSILLYTTGVAPAEDIVVQLMIEEVRRIG